MPNKHHMEPYRATPKPMKDLVMTIEATEEKTSLMPVSEHGSIELTKDTITKAHEVFRVGATGTRLAIPEDTPIEVCLALHKELGLRRVANAWHWVDLMEFTGTHYGETYKYVCLYTGWSVKRAANVHSIGKQWKEEDRLPGLPFYYYEVACTSDLTYEERMKLIRKAYDNGLTAEILNGLVADALKRKGIQTKRKITGKQLAANGKDLHNIVDEQAQTIQQQEEEIVELRSEVDELKTVLAAKPADTAEVPPETAQAVTELPAEEDAADSPDLFDQPDAAETKAGECDPSPLDPPSYRQLETYIAQLEGDLAFYCKLRPLLDRIDACIEEDILAWLEMSAVTLEEEAKFYAEGKN